MQLVAIQIILTGGTIDSYYDGRKDTAVPNKKSVIPDYLKSLKLYVPLQFRQVCMKDSRSLTEKDRLRIAKVIESSSSKKIIITHGTYTMPETARFLASKLKRHDQTIILTGSMIPLVGFTPSDGAFSLGYAIAKVQELPAGIHVCMNGKVFAPDAVKKNVKKGRFEN